jgi:hypothetical protein
LLLQAVDCGTFHYFYQYKFFFFNFFGVSLFIKLVAERMARYASFADVLRKYDITPAKRAKLNDEVHHLMPELTHYFNSLQARQLKGEVMTLEVKDFFNYSNLLDSLMFLQAGVSLPLHSSPVEKRYKLVFGDNISENFKRFIEKHPFPEIRGSQSSSSSKDHAATVLSLSESYDKQVWIFDQVSLISCFIDIAIHFISLRTASAS